ncbi:vacuolar ATPase assembly integral membrane protein VMA21 homolog [Condylostylus longicornis]|uniref:vacuolar ATPase assembly integral membrane protein VMA21 homolog n=1 Tax=Condylostylus longicornis TaxID=2530218 RepID=UPI00244E2832|nr:vacuolar ATPase assembly integral membrane protein VMA21 homolog [Condylostylus longicornis]
MGNKNKLNKQVKQSNNEAYNSFKVVLFYCLLIIFLPIVSFFGTKYILESNFDINHIQTNIYSAISAVIGLHIALGLYIAKAYFSEPGDFKQD